MEANDQLANEETEMKKLLTDITLRVWSDPDFAKSLKNDPEAALASIGASFPPRLNVHFHIDTEKDVHFTIPTSPAYFIDKNLDFHLSRLSKLHAEVTCTTSWASKPDR